MFFLIDTVVVKGLVLKVCKMPAILRILSVTWTFTCSFNQHLMIFFQASIAMLSTQRMGETWFLSLRKSARIDKHLNKSL